jgi:hypothetical protein
MKYKYLSFRPHFPDVHVDLLAMIVTIWLRDSLIPPIQESLHFCFLRRVVHDLQQTVVEPLRVRDGVWTREYRWRTKRKSNLSLFWIRK